MRPIDADEIFSWYVKTFKGKIEPNDVRFSMYDIQGNLDHIPTLDVVWPAVKGVKARWIFPYETTKLLYAGCSNCGFLVKNYNYKFCPNCGLPMMKPNEKSKEEEEG